MVHSHGHLLTTRCLAVAFGAAILAGATAAAAAPLDVPALADITIDGESADWGDAGLRVDLLAPNRPQRQALSDLDGRVRLGWDQRGVLLLAEVTDDEIVEAESQGSLWAGDGMELFLAASIGAADLVQYAVAPGASEDYPDARWYLHDWRQKARLKQLAGDPEFAGARTATGYIVEGLVPWAPLDIGPALGLTVAFQFYINDRDEQGFERLLFFPGENAHMGADPYRELRLAAGPGPALRLIERVTLPASETGLVRVDVEVRCDAPVQSFTLGSGTTTLTPVSRDTLGSVHGLEFRMPAAHLERLAAGLELRADGDLMGPVSIGPAYLKAGELLSRGKRIAQDLSRGRLPHSKRRAAALVLAWSDLLAQTAIDQGDRDLGEVTKRSQNVEVCSRRLEQALADYEAAGDVISQRRGGFLTAYISTADQSGQIYSLYVPPHYSPDRAWPLHVHMHGYGGTYGGPVSPDPAPDHLMAFVDGRGQTGYMGLGERDVLDVIADVRQHYHVDENRIYARGGSMGGRGTWSVTTRNPDLFAAALPDYGWADELFIRNLGNTPVWNFHDDTDWSVAVDHSRATVEQLREWGYPIIHTEATGGGHSPAEFKLQDEREAWLAQQVRDPYPRRVRHGAWTPYKGSAFWLEIVAFSDPNVPATVDARVEAGNQLFLTTRNVQVLRVELADALFDTSAPLWILGKGDPRTVDGPLPAQVYVMPETDTGVQVSVQDPNPQRRYRPYIAGGLNYIWASGEPFVIVRPTQGADAALLESRAAICAFLSRETGSGYWEQMPIGQIRIVDDVDVDEAMMAANNLVLVGPASANAALGRLMDHLPVQEREDELILLGKRLSFTGRMYNLFYYNPLAPQRYVGVISSAEVDSLQPRMAVDFLHHEGALGFHLKEITPEPRELRRVRWDAQWQPQIETGDEQPLPGRLSREADWAQAFARAACTATGSEFFFGYLPEDPASHAWDHEVTTWGDVRCDLDRPQDFYRATLTGAELTDLARAAADSLEGTGFVPPLDPAGIKPTAIYRICMPSQMSWSLAGDLHRNLPGIEWARTDALWRHFARQQRGDGE